LPADLPPKSWRELPNLVLVDPSGFEKWVAKGYKPY
jgi:hypothetical protein